MLSILWPPIAKCLNAELMREAGCRNMAKKQPLYLSHVCFEICWWLPKKLSPVQKTFCAMGGDRGRVGGSCDAACPISERERSRARAHLWDEASERFLFIPALWIIRDGRRVR